MILEEWNTEDAIAFARKEGREDGWEDGLEKGLEQGREEKSIIIARNLLLKGSTHKFVQEITGLDGNTIQGLSQNQ